MIYILLAILVVALPRLCIVLVWILTDWFSGVFDSILWPIAGFLFAPLTMIWYSVVMNIFQGHWGWLQIAVLVLTILIDLSPAGKTRKKKR